MARQGGQTLVLRNKVHRLECVAQNRQKGKDSVRFTGNLNYLSLRKSTQAKAKLKKRNSVSSVLHKWHRFFSHAYMENNDKQLQEQQAPLKNSDNAFVQVGKNGEPVIPQTTGKEESESSENDRTTTLDKQ